MIQTLDITNESEGKKKTICCKGQKFIVTLQKTQGERKKTKPKQNKWKTNQKKSFSFSYKCQNYPSYTDHSLMILIFNITFVVMRCVHTKYSKLNKANK